uniref:Uncharacterized protein n=1 Tax=Avena sativa TaxID=4498 RepID=A0ACD5YWS5_AVESA
MIGCHVDGDQKAQQLSLAYAQKLWNEKGLQCMVLVSFALQVNILLYGVIRKRCFGFQSLLWLAYQMTDFVAVFVLAHLSLQTNDPHHQLVLLWAPVLLLHLGGQDNATAFSMEDNELWKRHLLGLITQVVLAIYVVAKSWHDKQLVAPVVLLFLSGTVKYAERTGALKTATPKAIKDKHMGDVYEALKKFQDPKGNLVPSEIVKYSQEIVGQNKWWLQEDYADLVKAAFDSLPSCMGVLYEIPVAPWMLPSVLKLSREISQHHRGGSGQAGSKKKDWSFSSRANKMVEIQLVLISDLLYTKFGIRYNQPMILRIGLRLLTLGTTLTALLLFVMARKDSIYSRVDILVTYILLAGAVTLEVCSMLMVTISSYCFLREKFGVNMFTRAIFCPLRITQSFPYWSNRVHIYNLVGGCIMKKQASSLTSVVCPPHYYSMWISEETKELICNELDDEDRCQQFSHVRGQGILALREHGERSEELYDSIDKVDFPRSVLTWHLVTDICFFLTGGVASQHDQPRMRLSQEVSNYLMNLLMQQRVMDSSEGYVAHLRAQEEVELMLARHGEKVRKTDDIEAIKKMLEAGLSRVDTPTHSDEVEGYVVDIAPEITDTMRPVLPQAWSLAQILLPDPADGSEQGGGAPWKLIASVWMEMLFYLAPRCRAGFHAEKLNARGEFITHVRFMLHNRGLGWNCAPTRT